MKLFFTLFTFFIIIAPSYAVEKASCDELDKTWCSAHPGCVWSDEMNLCVPENLTPLPPDEEPDKSKKKKKKK